MKGKPCNPEDLEKDYLKIKNELGYYPSLSEYKQNGGQYSEKPFRTHFGSWANFIKKMGGEVNLGGYKRFLEADLDITTYTDYFRVNAHKLIATGDQHIPYHSPELCNKLIDFNKKFKATDLLVIGDVQDFTTFYKKRTQKTKKSWIAESKETRNFFRIMINYFERIWWILGNHDFDRPSNKFESPDEAKEFLDWIKDNPRIKRSNHYYCLVNDWIYFNHPDTARKNKLGLEDELAEKYNKSVINFHTHRFAYGINKSGRHVIGNGLCMTDADKHEYKNIRLTTHDEWVQGWWCVEDKTVFPHAIHPHLGSPFKI